MSSLALRENVPLLRNRPFRAYWAGQTVSFVGDQISVLALPLVGVLTLDASAAQMGVLTALGWAPHLIFSLFAGTWIDTRERRIARIGPGVDRDVALGEHRDAGNAVRLEAVQMQVQVRVPSRSAGRFRPRHVPAAPRAGPTRRGH